MLSDLLRSHEMIECDGELFLHWRWLPERYVLRRMYVTSRPVYGFKLLTYQPRACSGSVACSPILDWLESNGFRIIYLRWDGVLRHARSSSTPAWTNLHNMVKAIANDAPLHVDRDSVFYWMKELIHRRMLDEAIMKDREFLDVRYERDLENSENWHPLFLRISQFLEIEPHSPNSELKKVSPRNLNEIVDNFKELRDMLSGTEFEKYLDEQL